MKFIINWLFKPALVIVLGILLTVLGAAIAAEIYPGEVGAFMERYSVLVAIPMFILSWRIVYKVLTKYFPYQNKEIIQSDEKIKTLSKKTNSKPKSRFFLEKIEDDYNNGKISLKEISELRESYNSSNDEKKLAFDKKYGGEISDNEMRKKEYVPNPLEDISKEKAIKEIKELKELLDSGIISKTEYNNKAKELKKIILK